MCGAAPFLTGRGLEQIKADVAYSQHAVVLCGMSPGFAYGELGPTHHSIEDLSWLRALPGLDIVVPADHHQTRRAVEMIAADPRPTYIRVGRFAVPEVSEPGDPFERGRMITAREGADATVVAVGTMVSRSLGAAAELAAEGIDVRVLDAAWIAPFDRDAVVAAATETAGIVTAEEAVVSGGLGAAVAGIVSGLDAAARRRVVRLGIDGEFAPTGDTDFLLEHFGLTADGIAAAVREVLGAWLTPRSSSASTRARARRRRCSSTATERCCVAPRSPSTSAIRGPAGSNRTPSSSRSPSSPPSPGSSGTSTRATMASSSALGVSAQRESAIVWERASGKALGPVLGWQDRRTQDAAATLTVEGAAGDVRSITGLPLDPMFSALKFGWLLDTVDPDRRRSRSGEIAVGTVDSWILAALTGQHRIEAGNASRTQLLDLASAGWSERLCDLFGVPSATLPEVVASDAPVTITAGPLAGVPVAAVLADSHAATYAHGIRTPGRIKATYGTGSSIMALSEGLSGSAATGLTETIAWQIGTTSYALEGNILATGATVRWMAELLDCTPNDLHELAAAVTVPSDVTVVPAFSGLGAPWWDPHARGLIANLDLATGRGDLARAAFESIAHQIEDVVETVVSATGTDVDTIAADGGPSGNDWLMQLQADTSQRAVVRSAAPDLSALGVADLAAVTVGVRPASAPAVGSGGTRFEPDPTVDAARRRSVWSRRPRPRSASRADTVAHRTGTDVTETATTGEAAPVPDPSRRIGAASTAAGARSPSPVRPWMVWVGLLVVFLVAAGLTTERVSMNEDAEGEVATGAVAYVDERWESEILPALTEDADDLATVLDGPRHRRRRGQRAVRQVAGRRQRLQLRRHGHRRRRSGRRCRRAGHRRGRQRRPRGRTSRSARRSPAPPSVTPAG